VYRVIHLYMGTVLLLCTSVVRAADVTPSTTDVETPATVTTTPVHESMPLGTPNGMLQARPAKVEVTSALGEFDPRNNDLVRVLLALGAVVVLLFGVRKLMRRAGGALGGGRRPSGILQVHARYPVARGQHLVLVQVGPRMLLVHQGSGTMRTLSEFQGDELTDLRGRLESGERSPQVFQRLLQAQQGHAASAASAADSSELVDLTKGRGSGAAWWRRVFGGSRAV
jgi:flagellar biogenesis protein FliO